MTKNNWILIFYTEQNILFSAPGTYSPEKVNLDKAPRYSFGHRVQNEKPSDTPGKYFTFLVYDKSYLVVYSPLTPSSQLQELTAPRKLIWIKVLSIVWVEKAPLRNRTTFQVLEQKKYLDRSLSLKFIYASCLISH